MPHSAGRFIGALRALWQGAKDPPSQIVEKSRAGLVENLGLPPTP